MTDDSEEVVDLPDVLRPHIWSLGRRSQHIMVDECHALQDNRIDPTEMLERMTRQPHYIDMRNLRKTHDE